MAAGLFGETATQLPILSHQFGESGAKVLILGGVHGDEIEGVWAAMGLLKALFEGGASELELRLTLVPILNVDGVLRSQRRNANGIDLNRNLPTQDWVTNPDRTARYYPGEKPGSEPENQALIRFIEVDQPHFIISLHSWKPLLNINGDCRFLAESIAAHTGDLIEESIGYPTPGCLGTYAGLERQSPTLTYEIERGLDQATVLHRHVPALMNGLQTLSHRPRSGHA